MGIGAGISALGSVAGGLIQSGAAGSAAQSQTQAAQQALQALNGYYNLASNNLTPYINTGTGANTLLGQLTGATPGGAGNGSLTAAFNPTQSQLEQTPGYQFNLNQGLKAVQNSAAARGLGSSGEALAGGANYASGLASTTYQQQFQNYLSQNQQIYNMLAGLSGSGQSAASTLGGFGMQAGGSSANIQTQLGQGIAGSQIAQGNQLSGIAGTLGGAYTGYNTANLLGSLAPQSATGGSLGSIISGLFNSGAGAGPTSTANYGNASWYGAPSSGNV